MDLTVALDWAAQHKHGVLITIRADGRPQSSDIVYVVDGDAFLISLTDDRAKTRNLRRDPRAVLHLTEPLTWSYVSFDGTVDLSPVTTEPGDETSERLVAYYERATGDAHPDWDEYRRAMVEQRRLVARFTPTAAVGQVR
jgi:PPOX class probable F420-dependent enzyme